MRERKRDTWIASIGWGCDRAGLRGGGFVGVFGPFLSGVWALVLVCYFFFFRAEFVSRVFDTFKS